jgi:hypothetical protein
MLAREEGTAMVTQGESSLRVQVVADADPEHVTGLTDQLRSELLELDVNDVALDREHEVPEGARGAEMAVVGALLVKLGPALVAPVVRVIQSWLQRSSARSVELELNGQKITVTGASSADQERLISAWIAGATQSSRAP